MLKRIRRWNALYLSLAVQDTVQLSMGAPVMLVMTARLDGDYGLIVLTSSCERCSKDVTSRIGFSTNAIVSGVQLQIH